MSMSRWLRFLNDQENGRALRASRLPRVIEEVEASSGAFAPRVKIRAGATQGGGRFLTLVLSGSVLVAGDGGWRVWRLCSGWLRRGRQCRRRWARTELRY